MTVEKRKSVTGLGRCFSCIQCQKLGEVFALCTDRKSISVVVPPKAAAIVPVSKISALVSTNGMSRWCAHSIPPGMTRCFGRQYAAGVLDGQASTDPEILSTNDAHVGRTYRLPHHPFRFEWTCQIESWPRPKTVDWETAL